jgi:signal transduction histidine kinase
VRLLTAIERVQRRPLPVLIAGIALEALVMSLIGIDDGIRGVRGIGGESAALLAVIGAVFAGPWVGVAMATVGWSLFFPLVAESHPSSIVALPEWALAAYLVGALSSALVHAEGERERAELQRRAAHALRAPVATIHGLVQVLQRDRRPQEPILRSIEDETERLLRSPLFERDA